MNVFQFIKSKIWNTASDESLEAAIMRKHRFTPVGEHDKGDIFVCGWPKSGNTWCQRLFSGIVWGLDTSILTDQLAQFLQPDVHYKSYYYRFITPTLFKSHLPPQANYRKVIFLVRDGRDALVSYWKMLKQDCPTLSLEELFSRGDDLFPCAWETHAKLWIANPFKAQILTVRYEDLLTRPLEQLRQVSSFICVPRTDQELQNTIDGADIAKMKRVATRNGWDNGSSPHAKNFLGAGRTGEYLTNMSNELQDAYLRRAGEVLRHFGYV